MSGFTIALTAKQSSAQKCTKCKTANPETQDWIDDNVSEENVLRLIGQKSYNKVVPELELASNKLL